MPAIDSPARPPCTIGWRCATVCWCAWAWARH